MHTWTLKGAAMLIANYTCIIINGVLYCLIVIPPKQSNRFNYDKINKLPSKIVALNSTGLLGFTLCCVLCHKGMSDTV